MRAGRVFDNRSGKGVLPISIFHVRLRSNHADVVGADSYDNKGFQHKTQEILISMARSGSLNMHAPRKRQRLQIQVFATELPQAD